MSLLSDYLMTCELLKLAKPLALREVDRQLSDAEQQRERAASILERTTSDRSVRGAIVRRRNASTTIQSLRALKQELREWRPE